MHAQSATFHQAILKIEGQSISAIEAMKEINKLKNNLAMKQSTLFLPHSVCILMAKLQETDCSSVDEEQIKTTAAEFYKISKNIWSSGLCSLKNKIYLNGRKKFKVYWIY